MGRPHRPRWPGALYHAMAHGGDERPLLGGDFERCDLLDRLEAVTEICGWVCHSYCLMSSHYHLLVETPLGNISEGMHRLNGGYARTYNKRHGRRGPVFRSRFHSVLVVNEPHLVVLSRYLARNPVGAGLCERPEDWPWSSYAATLGLVLPRPFLTTSWLLGLFDPDVDAARRRYRAYVESPWS